MQDPLNNVVRTTIEAMAAVLGGTQSLHTNSYDEAISLPTETAARIARNTQLILQEETDITHTVDPFGGSYAMEALTKDLADKARELIAEVEKLGGMSKAIETGMPKRRIEEAAAKKQAAIDSGTETIVGVNKYTLAKEDDIDVRDIDNSAVRESQIRRLDSIRGTRNQAVVDESLKNLEKAASDPKQNLLELAVVASRARATVGEISDALERVYGRHRATQSTISGVYERMYTKKDEFNAVRKAVEDFATSHGRRPRILVVKMGQDGHDRGAKVVSTAFADMGFDVDVGPLFSTPQEAARMAVENDVHVIGVSSLAAGHKTLIPQLMSALKEEGAEDILVVAGGVIPAQDYEFLTKNGVALIFGPGTNLPKAGLEVVRMLT